MTLTNSLIQQYLKYLRYLRTSRGYFKNWFPTYLKYFLYRVSFLKVKVFKVICKDNSVIIVTPTLYNLLLRGLSTGLIKDIKCADKVVVFKDRIISLQDASVDILEILLYEPSINVLETLLRDWKYDEYYGYWVWVKGDVKFKHFHGSIFEVFEGEEYKALNVKDRVVVDIGAYVGDSAIYFALRGAKKIIAVEPHQGAFKEMLENIKLNNLENVIIPVNAGLASKPGSTCVEDTDIMHAIHTYHKRSKCYSKVSTTTLEELINKYNIDRDVVLKMDCEGCEYDVILNDYEHIKHFKEIIFEYHGDVSKLLKVLTEYYRCTFIRRGKRLGLIHCVRMSS